MPDPLRKTVSASQVAGLFNLSPYVTRFSLYHHFKNGVDIDDRENTRMTWGKRMQSLILEAAAEEMRVQIEENAEDSYVRSTSLPLGCTRDAHVIDPSRGFGIIEAKNVDGWIFEQQWRDGMAPKHIELQHQAQLMVPDPVYGPPQWGAIVVLVGGNQLEILPRSHNPTIQAEIEHAAAQFFADVEAGNEPDPFGTEREIAVLNQLYPENQLLGGLDLTTDPQADSIEAMLVEWQKAYEDSKHYEKVLDSLKPKILALVGDCGIVKVREIEARVKKSIVKPSYAKLPKEWLSTLMLARKLASQYPDSDSMALLAGVNAILAVDGIETRKGGVRNLISVTGFESARAIQMEQEEGEYAAAIAKLYGQSGDVPTVLNGGDRTTSGAIGQP